MNNSEYSMKTILFLHRMELTDLYILVAKAIGNRMRVVHVVFDQDEALKLEHAGIKDYINYTSLTNHFFDTEKLSLTTLAEIDQVVIEASNKRFNINAMIQSDRGFTLLTYDQALLSAQVHYKAWTQIFDTVGKVDYMLHETCSLFFNHIASLLCKYQGGTYLWQGGVKSDIKGDSYMFHTHDDYSNREVSELFDYYANHTEEIDLDRCKKFISEFRQDFSVLYGNLMSPQKSTLQLLLGDLKYKIRSVIRPNFFDPLKQNIQYWLYQHNPYREKLDNVQGYKSRGVCFEQLPEGEDYYYYSFHLEPEAVVLYLADGFYTNQVKLIENIAASLPVGAYLYVKDHPHEYAYRQADDYVRLMNIPNVRLLDQSIPGKQVINNSIGVFTLNATAGFEAFVLGKQVYCMGWNYYCYHPRVHYVHNVRDLRQLIYDNRHIRYTDDVLFYAYIYAFLQAAHPGFINYFGGLAPRYCKDPQENAQLIADQLISYSEKY